MTAIVNVSPFKSRISVWIVSIKYRYNVRCGPYYAIPDDKIHGANMGPIWGRQDPGEGGYAGPVNFATLDNKLNTIYSIIRKNNKQL